MDSNKDLSERQFILQKRQAEDYFIAEKRNAIRSWIVIIIAIISLIISILK